MSRSKGLHTKDEALPLSGKRYRILDEKMRNIYLTVGDDPVVGTPLEIWVTMPDENKLSEQVLKTDVTTVVALFTEARQGGVPYTKLIRAMEKVCYSKQAIPAKILNVLLQHCPKDTAERLEFEHSE